MTTIEIRNVMSVDDSTQDSMKVVQLHTLDDIDYLEDVTGDNRADICVVHIKSTVGSDVFSSFPQTVGKNALTHLKALVWRAFREQLL